MKFVALSFLFLTGCMGVTSHTPAFVDLSSNGASGERVQDGAKLYTDNCSGCHGALSFSSKIGRNSTDIANAIKQVPAMSIFKSFTAQEVDLIARALSSTPIVAPPVTTADQFYFNTNPKLYSLGRQYFPGDSTASPLKRIFRLTRTQLDIAVKGLLPSYYTTSITSVMARDPLQTNYEFANIININSSNFTPLTTWIEGVVTKVKANPAGVVNCTASANSLTCLQTQARAFITKAFRADVSEAKLAQITKFFTDSVAAVGINEATGDLVDVVLSSPQFLYRYEFATGAGNVMTAPEVLQSLTFTFADSPAEQVSLSSTAAATSVGTPAAVKSTVTSLLGTAQARDKLKKFFEAWLEIREPNDFTLSPTDYPQFDAQGVVDETRRFLNLQLSKVNPKLKDLTQATQEYQGTSLVNIDVSQKLGIFSQEAVLASHSGPVGTRPVKRGVFWVRKVMCMDLMPPPSGVDTTLPPTGSTTERQRIESVTKQAACTGCHSVINPFGFFQESWDPTGKWRTTDNGLPVDSSVSTEILDEGPLKATRSVDALKTFTNSAKFKQCFVRQMFRYFMGRLETPADDQILREMFYSFSDNDNQDILTLLNILGNSKTMSQRAN